jgi:hypothetical protein
LSAYAFDGVFNSVVRSLLVFLVAVSVPLGWFAWEMEKARRQREVVKRIMEMDGSAFYDWQDSWRYRAEPPTPAWLRKLFGEDFFSDVVQIRFSLATPSDSRNVLDDDGLEHLKTLTNLRRLDLPNTPITEEGLDHLTTLTNLEHLWIACPHVTEKDLARLRHELPGCEIIHLVAP